MGIVIKQSIRTTLISYIGVIIGTFNVLWLYPKFLEPENIGIIRLLQDIPTILALFVQVGAFNLTDRFFNEFKNKEKGHNGFLSFITLYPLIGYSIFLISYFVFHDFWISIYATKSGLFTEYLIYILPLTFLMIYTSLLESYLRIHMDLVFSSFLREVVVRIFYSSFVLLYALKLIHFDILILLITIGYGISLFLLLGYAKRLNILIFTRKIQLPYKGILSKMFSYAFFVVSGTAGSILAHKIDTIMLGAISGTEKNEGLINIAVYSLAYYIGSVIEIPRKSLSQIAIPLLSKAYTTHNEAEVAPLYKKFSLIQLISGVFIFSLIWINVDYLFNFVPNATLYRTGKFIILIIGIAKISDMITSINGEIILFSKHYKFNLVAVLFMAVCTITTSLLLIPKYKIMGAAIALAITIVLFNIIKTYYIWKKMKLSPFTASMIPLLLFLAVIILISYLLPYWESTLFESFIQIILRSTIITIVFYIMIRKLKISEDLNAVIDVNLVKIADSSGMFFLKKF
jgi:O-antigen/teichoic acid export membrane protein